MFVHLLGDGAMSYDEQHFQDLEEERLAITKDAVWGYANAISVCCVADDEVSHSDVNGRIVDEASLVSG